MQNRIIISFTILLIFFTNNVIFGKENGHTYFPSSLGSFWIYEDQDGNEFTRRVSEVKTDDGKVYVGFKCEPELKDWNNFIPFLHASFCHYGEDWVNVLVGENLKKKINVRLNDELELFSKLSIKSLKDTLPPNANITVTLDYETEAETQRILNLLPMKVDFEEEWKSIETNAKITMKFKIEGLQIFQDAEDFPTTMLEFAIVEKGKILGKETVETEAGTFDECLKIVYKTETKMTETRPIAPADLPGESVTTLWFAPKIGIVKMRSETEKIFLHALSDRELVKKHASEKEAAGITKPTVKTLQLKKFKIVSEMDQNKHSK